MRRGIANRDPADETTARQPTEQEIVRSHVEQRFRDLGFNELQAQALADLGVDWHDAEKLLDKGCDHPVALDILS